MTEYRLIPGCSGYRIDEFGGVQSCLSRFGWRVNGNKKWTRSNTWRRMKPEINHRGYLRICLMRDDGKRWAVYVHTLVLSVFVFPRPDGMVACHCDGNKLNNHFTNLRWDTAKSNIEDERKHGTLALGERNGKAKFNEKDVVSIRQRAIAGEKTKAIAKSFQVDVGTIRRIVLRKRWAHV